MSNVIPLIQPVPRSILVAALDEITNPDTDAVIIITSSPDGVHVRSFGDDVAQAEAMRMVRDAESAEGAA